MHRDFGPGLFLKPTLTGEVELAELAGYFWVLDIAGQGAPKYGDLSLRLVRVSCHIIRY